MLKFLVLHPSHKLNYFKAASWTDEWCETAEDIVHAEFEHAYADIEVGNDKSRDSVSSFLITQSFNFILTYCLKATQTTSDNIFDTLPALSAPQKSVLADELKRYLAAPTEATLDPLLWWIEKEAVYPRLSRMAHNYLCIPGMFHSSSL
jgi:DNA-directed RNA polymerase specialized sigma24 family protein